MRIGGDDLRTTNEGAGGEFHIWLNCSTKILSETIAARKAARKGVTDYNKAKAHWEDLESDLAKHEAKANDRLHVHFLEEETLVIDLDV